MNLRLLFTLSLFTALQASTISLAQSAPSHDLWQAQLQKYVSASGSVNYTAWKQNMTELQQYLTVLEAAAPQSSWSHNEQLAYWINAYNAYTVKLILTHFPVSSIKEVEQPWDKKFITIAGTAYSLNEIENTILRGKLKEPRIHFAVNCAAKSCPPLLNKAYTATNVQALLEQQARKFVGDTRFNSIAASEVALSNIFNWYRSDFEQSGSLIDYLNKYSQTPISSSASISFKEYDWRLNGK
ncbi:MAG: DUF547 domain-containing protein [Bacteroidia bacterium]|nr:DUF547 domain-containing protein [Bacteroidia bacterium]